MTAGTQGNIVGAWDMNIGNNPVWLESLNLHVIGSANKGDLRNVKLMVNGTQVGQTISAVPASGLAYFNMQSAPAKLNTGDNNVQLVSDVMGSPSFNFQFELLNGYDVLAVDSQYNVPVGITNTSGSGTAVSIAQGTITISQDTATPTGNIAVGQSGVPLAKFDIYAGGEAVKIQYIGFQLAFTGEGATTSLSSQVKNISLSDDAGNQVGTTINTPPSGNTCDVSASNGGAATAAYVTSTVPATYVDCFGTSGSNINYIVPANTTRVLTLKADIQSTASFTSVLGSLLQETTANLQGLTSSQTGSSSGAAGSSLTLQSSLLTTSQNNAVGTQTLTPNTQGATIGSFALTASSAGGVQVNTVSVKVLPNGIHDMGSVPFQNVRLQVGGTQFGNTQSVVTTTQTIGFSGSPFTVPAGSTVIVNVLADTLSSATGTTAGGTAPASGAVELTSCTGTGLVSYNSITCSSVGGQNISFNGAGTTLAITSDFSQQAATQYVLPSSQVSLGTFDFSETKNIEPVKVTALAVTAGVPSSTYKPAFSNLQLYNGATSVAQVQSGVAGSMLTTSTVTIAGTSATGTQNLGFTIDGVTYNLQVASATVASGASSLTFSPTLPTGLTAAASGGVVTFTAGNGKFVIALNGTNTTGWTVGTLSGSTIGLYYTYTFNSFNSSLVVLQNGSVPLTLKGDLSGWATGSATDNSSTTFSVATPSDVTALGTGSSKTPTVTLTSAKGNAMTVLRTTLTPSLAAVGSTRSARSTQDQVATVTVAANSAGPATLKSLTLTITGSLVSSTVSSTFMSSDVSLWLNGTALSPSTQAVPTSTGNTITWTFWTGSATGTQIAASGSDVFQVVIDDADTAATTAGSQGISLGLNIAIQNTGDVSYTDSSLSDTTGSTVNLPANILSGLVTQISFGQGV